MYTSIQTVGLRRLLAVSSLALGIGAVGCAVPESPEWDVGVALPFATDPIAIADFLPADVSVDTVNGVPTFTVALQTQGESYTLGQLCGSPCVVLNGVSAPVPAFAYQDTVEVMFAAELIAAEVTSATLDISLNNGLNFDPLRPDPDPSQAGTIILLTRDAITGALLDSTHLSGASQTLPPSSNLLVPITLNDVTINEGVRTEVLVDSPNDGQVAVINTAQTAGFGITLDNIAVSSVTALVDNETLDEDFSLDIDSELRGEVDDRLQAGSLELELTHDIEIDGNLEISLAGSTTDLFSGSALTEVRLQNFDLSFAPSGRIMERTLTAAELDFIVAQEQLFVGYRGNVVGMVMNQGRPTATVTPIQSIDAKIKVTAQVRVGG